MKECNKDIQKKVGEQKSLQKENHAAELKIKETENKINTLQKDSREAIRMVCRKSRTLHDPFPL